ncbi:hypothetical protein WJX77_006094 [Trebouxia sp. C0004]
MLQHGARRVHRGRQRPQQQISHGRRRAQDYEQDYEQEYEQGIAPAPAPVVEQRSLPLFVTIPGILLVVFALFKIFKKIQGRGSVTGLVSRGLVQEEKGTNKGDPYYKDIMKHVNTVDMEQLSDDQIAAARARRMKERDIARFDIEKMDLPENHPFAVAKKVSKDEEELAKKRLSVKRGLPLQDLTGKRGFPDDPRLEANQKLQAESEMLDEQAARAREARLARQAAAQQQQK